MIRIRSGSVRPKRGDNSNRIWIIDWTDHKNKRHQLNFNGTKRQALYELEKLRENARRILIGIDVEIPEITLKAGVLKFIKYLEDRERKNETIRRYGVATKPFLKFMGAANNMSGITLRDIEKYENHRLASVKPETYKSDIRMLKFVFSWLRKMEHIRKNPFEPYSYESRKNPSKASQVMTIKEILSFLVAALETNVNSFEVALFFLATGMRGSEVSKENLNWGGVSFKNECFSYILKSKMDTVVTTRDMTPVVKAILEIRAVRGGVVPFNYSRQYMSRHILNPVFQKAGLSHFKAHDLRRTAGGHRYLETRDYYEASHFLGHSSVNVTKDHYVNLPSLKKYESDMTLSEIFGFCLQHTCKIDANQGQIRVWKEKELLETLKALTLI